MNLIARVLHLFGANVPEFLEYPRLIINEDGWLEGDGVVHVKSHPSWFYPKLSTSTGAPIAIVTHCSDTLHGTADVMAAKRTKPRRPRLPEHKDEDVGIKFDRTASWHVSIEEQLITQMISFEAGAWHGVGVIPGVGACNRSAVGIEFIGKPKGPWLPGQIINGCRVYRALAQSYGIKRANAMIAHSSFEKKRSDPGVPFMKDHAKLILDYAFA